MIHCARDNCCVTLLIGIDKSWLFSGQVRLVSSNGQWNTHLCSKWTGTSWSIHSATGPVSRGWSNDGPGRSQHPLQLTWTKPLPVASLCVMESTLATDYSLLNHWCFQFTSHTMKVEGNLAHVIRTCQVFFSIFIYVQRLARSFQMPGMYCSLEELQYPAVFNVKGKPFH